MPAPKTVRFAYENVYHSPAPPWPPLSFSSSTVPSSIIPPNVAHAPSYGHQYPPGYPPRPVVPKAPSRYPGRVLPHRYLVSDAILWALLDPPSMSTRNGRHLSSRALLEPASEPPLPFIQIASQHLPWTCKVHASNGRYVTVSDVLESLYRSLRVNITQSDFHLLLEKDRRRATRAYEDRYRRLRGRAYEEEKRSGMKRVDFLMGRTRFVGLSADGHQPYEWHLRVT